MIFQYASLNGLGVTKNANVDGSTVANALGVLTLTGNFTRANALGTLTLTGNFLDTLAAAEGVLTLTDNFEDGEEIVVGPRTYVAQLVLTNSDGHFLIGNDGEESIDNLAAAIILDAGAGTIYAARMKEHPTVTAAKTDVDDLTVTAKVGGVGGNSIPTTTNAANATWGAATLEGGVDAEKISVDGKIYTPQTTLTNVDGHFLIGVTDEISIDNLVAAVLLSAGAGTLYAAATTLHPTVTAVKSAADEFTAISKVAGTGGNSIPTTTTAANATWGAATLENGAAPELVVVEPYTYRMVDVLAQAYDVLIGLTAEVSIDNIVLAANKGAGEGTLYGTGTLEHHDVVGSKSAADEFTATAKIEGSAANDIATTTTAANATWGAATLENGVDPQRFIIQAPVTPPRMALNQLIVFLRDAAVDDAKFGDLTALTNGLKIEVKDENDTVVRDVLDGEPIKTNRDFWKVAPLVTKGEGSDWIRAYFALDDKISLPTGKRLEISVRDDLTGLDELKIYATASERLP